MAATQPLPFNIAAMPLPALPSSYRVPNGATLTIVPARDPLREDGRAAYRRRQPTRIESCGGPSWRFVSVRLYGITDRTMIDLLVVLGAAAAYGTLFPAVRRTTLVRAWLWGVGAIGVTWWCGPWTEFGGGEVDAGGAAAMLAASFAPFLTRLGAKRPQYRAWDWVVAAFLFSFAVAVLLVMARRRSASVPELFLLLIVAGIAVQWLDNVATPAFFAVSLLTAGQLVLLLVAARYFDADRAAYGWRLEAAACFAAAWRYHRRPAGSAGWNAVWLGFRDRYGTLWSLRVVERFNAAARQANWPWRLSWYGIRTSDAAEECSEGKTGTPPPEVEQALRNLLERFVDRDWIDQRLGIREREE